MIRGATFSTLLICMLCSCTAKDEGVVQPYSAASNGAIAGQTVLGAENSRSSIRQIAFSNDGSLFSFGMLNGLWALSRMDLGGHIVWQRDPGFFVKSLCVFETPIASGGFALAVLGNSSSSSSDERSYGIIHMYDRDGETIARCLVKDPEYNIRLDGLRLVSDMPDEPVFFLAGGAGKDNVFCPFSALIRTSSDSTISIIKKKAFIDHPNEYFSGAAWNGVSSSPLYFASSMSVFSECPYWFTSETKACWKDLLVCVDDTLGIVWERTITPSDAMRSDIYAIDYSDGALYAAGIAEVKKAGGCIWEAALVASVSESGDINWSKSIILSDYYDSYYDLDIHQGTLYAVGDCAAKVQVSTNRCYGYALISKFKLPSGELENHGTFGNNECYSAFRTIKVNDNSAICGGTTHYYFYHYWFQGWLADIDIPSLASDLFVLPIPKDSLNDSSPVPPRLR